MLRLARDHPYHLHLKCSELFSETSTKFCSRQQQIMSHLHMLCTSFHSVRYRANVSQDSDVTTAHGQEKDLVRHFHDLPVHTQPHRAYLVFLDTQDSCPSPGPPSTACAVPFLTYPTTAPCVASCRRKQPLPLIQGQRVASPSLSLSIYHQGLSKLASKTR